MMKQKSFLTKLTASVLTVFLLLSVAGCDGVGDKRNENPNTLGGVQTQNAGHDTDQEENSARHEAYRGVVQSIVDKHGLIDAYAMAKARQGYATKVEALVDAQEIDITGDGKQELVVIYADSEYYHMEMYEYLSGRAVQQWKERFYDGFTFFFGMNNMDGKIYWYFGPNFNWAEDEFMYRNGNYSRLGGDDPTKPDLEWQSIDFMATDKASQLMQVNVYDGKEDFNTEQLISYWNLKVPETEITATQLLSGVKYHGDVTKCKMSKAMAEAYLMELVNVKRNWTDALVYAALMDVAGDGMPLLLISVCEKDPYMDEIWVEELGVWTWDGNTASRYDFTKDTIYGYMSDSYFCPDYNGGSIIIGDGDTNDVSVGKGSIYYSVSNAQLKKQDHYIYYSAVINNGEASGRYMPGVQKEKDEYGYYRTTPEELKQAGWKVEDYGATIYYKNGEKSSYEEIGSYIHLYELMEHEKHYPMTNYSISIGESLYPENWSRYDAMKSALEIYRQANMKTAVSLHVEYKDFENGVSYLERLFQTLEGRTPDSDTRDKIANYIGTYIAKKCTGTMKSKDGIVTVSAADISKALQTAEAAKKEMKDLLEKYEIQLNKILYNHIQFYCDGRNLDKYVQIVFENGLSNLLSEDDELCFVIHDDRFRVTVNKAALESMHKKHGTCTLHMQKRSDHTYSIEIYDEKGQKIHKLDEAIAVSLPSDDVMNTTVLQLDGKDVNWGGNYNDAVKSIDFMLSHSATYTVAKGETQIDDIQSVSEGYRQAVQYMVSRDILPLQDQKFSPEKQLTRYEFAEAFVKIFFEYDENLRSDFPDVAENSYYSPYVAGGEALGVIVGFEDGTFKGDRAVTREQVIAQCGRLLKKYKGYKLPQNAESLLHFQDRDNISDWAKEVVALSVREGLIEAGGNLRPTEAITKEESAEILYRLYQLLYGDESTNADAAQSNASLHRNGNKTLITVLVAVSAAVILLDALVIGYVILKKRKRK